VSVAIIVIAAATGTLAVIFGIFRISMWLTARKEIEGSQAWPATAGGKADAASEHCGFGDNDCGGGD
jgi:hypothetical protein